MRFVGRRSVGVASIVAIAFVTFCASATGVRAEEKAFFPLMAWDDVRSADTVKKMADCGINAIAFVPAKMLDACQQNGVKAIVFDERVTPAWDKPFNAKAANDVLPEIIKAVNDHPAVYGYHLKDEPDGGQFAELGKSAELVRKLAPGKWPYINLTPGMGDGYIKDHLEPFVETCKPPILSYDNYAIGERVSFSYGFWANMFDVRGVALRHEIPFHAIVLTSAHWNYRAPTRTTCGFKSTAQSPTARKGSPTTNSAASRSPCSTRRISAISAWRRWTSSARRP